MDLESGLEQATSILTKCMAFRCIAFGAGKMTNPANYHYQDAEAYGKHCKIDDEIWLFIARIEMPFPNYVGRHRAYQDSPLCNEGVCRHMNLQFVEEYCGNGIFAMVRKWFLNRDHIP